MRFFQISFLLSFLFVIPFCKVYCMELVNKKNNIDELLKKCDFYVKKNYLDSALYYYSVVCNSSEKPIDISEIRKLCYAYIQKSLIYLFYCQDYNQAYENLNKADILQKRHGLSFPFIYITYAIFYHKI